MTDGRKVRRSGNDRRKLTDLDPYDFVGSPQMKAVNAYRKVLICANVRSSIYFGIEITHTLYNSTLTTLLIASQYW